MSGGMYFPLYVDLSEKNILIAGGGRIASRRARVLQQFAGQITVVAPQFAETLRALGETGRVRLIRRAFDVGDLEGRDLVFAATDDKELNRQIFQACKERGIPVNVCSDKTLCDFQFPSVVIDGDVVIGINASWKDHRRVKEVRQELEKRTAGGHPGLYETQV